MKITVIPRLGEILKERNMTQTQLSELTGIPQGTISKFDKNKQHQDVHLFTISRELNIPIEDLFTVYKGDIDKMYPFFRYMTDDEEVSMVAEEKSDPNELVGQYLNRKLPDNES